MLGIFPGPRANIKMGGGEDLEISVSPKVSIEEAKSRAYIRGGCPKASSKGNA